MSKECSESGRQQWREITIEKAVQRRCTMTTSLNLPEIFNAADHFVDRHIREGRGERTAILCND